jgi:hypothetical protein
MIKYIIAFSLTLTGCGKMERVFTGITGGLTVKCSPSGVEYLQSDSGLAVHLGQNGNPVPCQKNGQ